MFSQPFFSRRVLFGVGVVALLHLHGAVSPFTLGFISDRFRTLLVMEGIALERVSTFIFIFVSILSSWHTGLGGNAWLH